MSKEKKDNSKTTKEKENSSSNVGEAVANAKDLSEEELEKVKEFEKEMKEKKGESLVITFPCEVNKVATMADGSISLKLNTPELEAEDMTQLFRFRNKNVNAALKTSAISKSELEEIPDDPDLENFGKSKSQRLRNTLFVLWKKKGEQGDFENFYKRKMEKFIDMVKAGIQKYE